MRAARRRRRRDLHRCRARGTDGRLHTAKTPTTPQDESSGVIAAIEPGARARGARPGAVEAFAHGTTVTTNALLEGDAARTALIATEGFTDVVELGRQARADLYRLCAAHPAAARAGGAALRRPRAQRPARAARPLAARHAALAERRARPRSVAIASLLHSSPHPGHELAARRAARARACPDVHVSLSHEVGATPREYERGATTELDAALSPLLARLPGDALAGARRTRGLPRARGDAVLGRADRAPPRAAAHGAFTVLSGPAGGVGGARCSPRSAGSQRRALLRHGRDLVRRLRDRRRRGRARPTSARSPGARWRCPASTSRRSAPAAARSPGATPAARCASGRARPARCPAPRPTGAVASEPTVTDAHVVLGHLPADAPLAGGRRRSTATTARARSARSRAELGLDPLRARGGDHRVANAEMLAALRVVTVAARRRPARATRCCPSAAPGRCTPPRSPQRAGDRADPLPARLRRAVGARPRGGGAAARRRRAP